MSYPVELAAREITPLTPGSPEWLQTISASKVSAILGTSKYESPVSLFHKIKGNVEDDAKAVNKPAERGTYLEESVLAWFRDQVDLAVTPGASFKHPYHDSWTAAPDSIGVDTETGEAVGVEAKTTQYADEWGTEGTWEIPPYYLAQAAWQMIVCGFKTIYFPILIGYPFEFRLYVVHYEDIEHEIQNIRDAVEEFEHYLEANIEPDYDGAEVTYTTVRKLHPLIDGCKQEITRETATRYILAAQGEAGAKEEFNLAKSLLAKEMGNAKTAIFGDHTIATRQVRGAGTPYLVISKKLPTLENTDTKVA